MDKKTLEKLQQYEIEILQEVDRICKKNNIEYSLAYGTAIGAVRHKGFIPWDDDIDIIMTIDNYKKFQKVVGSDLNKKNFYYQTYMQEKHGFVMWDKVRLNNTTSIADGFENIPMHFGICIDIFPLFKLPASKKLQKRNIRLLNLAYRFLETELFIFGHKKVGIIGKLVYFILSLIPRRIRKKIINMLLKPIFDYTGDFDDYVEYSDFYSKVRKIPKNLINDGLIKISFEGREYPIFKNYDEILTLNYGNYMKLPHVKERVSHGNLLISFEKEYDSLKKDDNK